MADAIFRRPDAGKTARCKIVGRVGINARRNDRERRDFAEVAVELLQPELHVRARLLACLRHVRERHDAPLAAIGDLAVLARRFLVNTPVGRVRFERIVGGAAERDHADAMLAGLQRAGWGARRGDRHLHHRLRVTGKLQARFAQVEPVGLLRDHAALHQLHQHVERLVELAPLVGRRKSHLVRVVNERTGADAEHRASARHVVELLHPPRERERVVIRQRHDAGAEPDVPRALGGGRDEHLRTIDDLEAARMMLADPGLVVVQLVEMNEQVHVALKREQRILVHRMKRREKDAGLHIAVVAVGHGAPAWCDAGHRVAGIP